MQVGSTLFRFDDRVHRPATELLQVAPGAESRPRQHDGSGSTEVTHNRKT
jgi:hypothetical protein